MTRHNCAFLHLPLFMLAVILIWLQLLLCFVLSNMVQQIQSVKEILILYLIACYNVKRSL